jgi:hypothetical protein
MTMALYDQIQELRRELRDCALTRQERARAEAELAVATARQAESERAFDQALDALAAAETTVANA